jgi:hypothetical protein
MASASSVFGRSPAVCDAESLVVEVANSVYAVRNHISVAGLRQLWAGLANFVNVSLKSHKVGVACGRSCAAAGGHGRRAHRAPAPVCRVC